MFGLTYITKNFFLFKRYLLKIMELWVTRVSWQTIITSSTKLFVHYWKFLPVLELTNLKWRSKIAHIDSRNDKTYSWYIDSPKYFTIRINITHYFNNYRKNRNKLKHLSSKTLSDTREKQIENIKSCGFGNPHIQNPSLCCQVYWSWFEKHKNPI